MKNTILLKPLLILTLVLFGIMACEEPFEIIYDLNKGVIIIDAVLTDEADQQIILLKESKILTTNKVSTIVPLQKCIVEVLVNNTQAVQFLENENDPGSYLGPEGFKAEANKTYQLIVKTGLGKVFKSTIEKLEKGTEVKNVYQKLAITGKPGDKNYSGVHKIFLDTNDPANAKNYYLWDWNLYEANEICKTCEPGERYYSKPVPTCIKDLPPAFRNVIYDYECYGACWEILHSNKINIMDDEFSNGKTITARPIADVPIYHLNYGAVLEVKQQAISAATYRYFKILMDQIQNSGGLADTPPVALIGNFESANNETIAGFFRVVDESKYYYWVDRSDVLKTDLKPVYLIGRPTNFEPSTEDITRPPLVPCIKSYTRTNIKPKGWQEPMINNKKM